MEGFPDKQKNVYKLELRGTENFKRGIPDTFGAMCEATLKSWNQTLLKTETKSNRKTGEKNKKTFYARYITMIRHGERPYKLVLPFPATITRGPN